VFARKANRDNGENEIADKLNKTQQGKGLVKKTKEEWLYI
jgi:hypothetical protein